MVTDAIISEVEMAISTIDLKSEEIAQHHSFSEEQIRDFYLQIYALISLDIEITQEVIFRIIEVIQQTVYFEFDPLMYAD